MAMDDAIERLAKKIVQRRADRLPLTYPSTPTGSNELAMRRDGIPLPLGAVGKVLTVVDTGGGVLRARWVYPAGGTSPQYRRYVVTNDIDSAGYIIMESAGVPLYDLVDLE